VSDTRRATRKVAGKRGCTGLHNWPGCKGRIAAAANAQRLAFNVSTFQTAVEGDPGRFLAVTQTPGRPSAGLKAPRVLVRYATHYRQMHFIFINMTRDAPSRRGAFVAAFRKRMARTGRNGECGRARLVSPACLCVPGDYDVNYERRSLKLTLRAVRARGRILVDSGN